jgi:Carboxypeptidase regulatory-like domain
MKKRVLICSVILLLSAGWVSGNRARAQSTVPDAPSALMEQSQGSATLSGVVKDVGGTPVGGASVELTGPLGNKLVAVTDEDGEYEFEGLTVGRYVVSVKAEGLADGRAEVTVPSARGIEVPEFALKLEMVNSEVEAVSQKEMAEIQLKEEEKQRVFGIIPNFYVAYDPNTVPLTGTQKFKLADRTAIDPITIASAALGAEINQALQTPVEWKQNWAGYGQRFGAVYAGTVVGVELSGAVFPAIFHQDPRYFYKGTGTTGERVHWALKQSIEQKGDNGKWQVGYSNMLGDVAASAVTVALYPHQNTNWGGTLAEDFALNIAGTAFGNLMEEFVVPKLHLHKKQPQTTP